MTEQEIRTIVENQRTYFRTGVTLDVDFRLRALRRLKRRIQANEEAISAALQKDLGKGPFESYMCEVGLVLSELTYMLRHTRAFAREQTVPTPPWPTSPPAATASPPHGVVLIMSPWNYPFMLTLDPLVDAIAAGNTVVLKPSAYSAHTTALLGRLIGECFPPEYVAVVTGGRAENTALLEQEFDYVFFTGSQEVGREVMRKAAEHLTPVTLELGGKSPCIVDKTANPKLAARRIAFGKFLNCGQTCVAPDYVYCDRRIKDAFVAELKEQTARQFGIHPLENGDYGKIINEKHFDRLLGLMDPAKVVHGGGADREALRIEPTILDNVTFEDAVMGEEIFGPILPVLTYDSLNEAVAEIDIRPHPLALYLFTSSKKAADYVTTHCGFGGGCINDVVIHLATSEMGFGGFRESGMGSYHGREGFDTFSHHKSMVDKKTWLDLPMRYQPYQALYGKMLRLFLR